MSAVGQAAAGSKLLRLIGLGVRGRGAIVGVQQVREAARRGKLHLAIAGPGATELGAAVGREKTAMVGIVDARLAAGIRALIKGAAPDERGEGDAG